MRRLLFLLLCGTACAQNITLSAPLSVPSTTAPLLGATSVAMADANTTLNATQAGGGSVVFSGSLTAARVVTVPSTQGRNLAIANRTTGGQPILIQGSATSPNQVQVLPGKQVSVFCDGTACLPLSASPFVDASTFVGPGPAEQANQATIYAIDNHISTVDTSPFLGLQPVSQEQWNRGLHVTTATTNPDPTQCNSTRFVGYRWFNSSSGARWTCQSAGQWVTSAWDGNYNGLTFILPGVASWPFNVPDPQAVAIMDFNGTSAIGPATGGGGSQFKVYPSSSSVNMWALHAIDQQYGDGLYLRLEGVNYSNNGATMGSGAIDLSNGVGMVDESVLAHMYVGNSTGDALRINGCCGLGIRSVQGYSAYGVGGGIPLTFQGGALYDSTANAAGTGKPNVELPSTDNVESMINLYTETNNGADTTMAVIDNPPLNAFQPHLSLFGWNAPAVGSKPCFSHPLNWGLVNLGGDCGAQNYIKDVSINRLRMVPSANYPTSPLSSGGNSYGVTDAGMTLFTPTAPGYYTVEIGFDQIGRMECTSASGQFAIAFGLTSYGGPTNVMRFPLSGQLTGVPEVDKVLTTTDGGTNQSVTLHVSSVPSSNAVVACTFAGQGILPPTAETGNTQGIQSAPVVATSLPTGWTVTWSDDLTQQSNPGNVVNPTLLLSGGIGTTALIPPTDHAHPIAVPTGRTGAMVTSDQLGGMAYQNPPSVAITGGVESGVTITGDTINSSTINGGSATNLSTVSASTIQPLKAVNGTPVAYSATPTFDASQGLNEMILTGNVTSIAFSNTGFTGRITCVMFKQDSNGGHSGPAGGNGVTWPLNQQISQGANQRTIGCWQWDGGLNGTWELLSLQGVDAPLGSSGTVTSVALQMPGTLFNATVPGSPVTTSGTLAPTLIQQSPFTFLAGPYGGDNAAPTFRVMQINDLPSQMKPSDYGSLNASTTLQSNSYWTHATCATSGITITLAPSGTAFTGQTYNITNISGASCTINGNGINIGNSTSPTATIPVAAGASVQLHNDGTAYRQE